MILSLFTGFGGAANAIQNAPAQNLMRDVNQRDAEIAASKENWEGAEVAMPLVLNQSMIGFSGENTEVEVQAVMTDVWYLGVLTIEEYASLFPAGVDLSRAEYLSRDVREYIAGISEEERLTYRSQAEAKLNMEQQFVWEAAMDDQDYSDKLAIEGKRRALYEATETMAPAGRW